MEVDEEKKAEKFVKEVTEKSYNGVILSHVQSIFAQLAFSKLQYCIPRGFWKHFKFVLPNDFLKKIKVIRPYKSNNLTISYIILQLVI